MDISRIVPKVGEPEDNKSEEGEAPTHEVATFLEMVVPIDAMATVKVTVASIIIDLASDQV